MKVRSLRIGGFGALHDRTFAFTPGLNVVFGPNESGKSTIANAIVATLYGAERKKDAWRPWQGGSYATVLAYELSNGQEIEVQRDFERDSKGVRVYDRSGNDLAANSADGKKLNPGEAHLGIPLDVFVNAACVKQQDIAIDEGKDAAPIVAHLARALSGGPREDAALGALKRLDDAHRSYVGTERARKNAPLRTLRDSTDRQAQTISEARARLAALDELRERIETAAHERDRLAAAASATERKARALRAGTIAKRIAALRDFREELAELQGARSAYADVEGFASEREIELNEEYHAWEFAERTARAAAADAAAAAPSDAERREHQARRADAGTLDEVAFVTLREVAASADAARLAASAAANEAAQARRATEGASGTLGGVLVLGAVLLCIAIGLAIAHVWIWTVVSFTFAAGFIAIAVAQGRGRAGRRREATRKQQIADDALARERIAAQSVAAVLDPLGLPSFEELAHRRQRLAELVVRADTAERAAERARLTCADAESAAARFDRRAAALAADITGARAHVRGAVNARAARKRERDGIDAHLNALEMRKSTILGTDDEFALEAELDDLVREGVTPQSAESPNALRLIEAERAEMNELLRYASEALSRLQGELASAETGAANLADLDECLARTLTEVARIEAFERAVLLAKQTIETRKDEAHQAFARRLEDYAAEALGAITAGRYSELFVDPATLAIKVRVPENSTIVELDALSSGTRDQAYLVVRFAMARMFSEGIETPPLLLDDPFAYWDAARVERCLPIIVHGSRSAQAIVFTSSEELAAAAVALGATRIDLSAPALLESTT